MNQHRCAEMDPRTRLHVTKLLIAGVLLERTAVQLGSLSPPRFLSPWSFAVRFVENVKPPPPFSQPCSLLTPPYPRRPSAGPIHDIFHGFFQCRARGCRLFIRQSEILPTADSHPHTRAFTQV
jgi:hypothetical protein